LDLALQQWQLSEEELFSQTRALYASGAAHGKKSTEEEQDWS
jgi:hypothetical protein